MPSRAYQKGQMSIFIVLIFQVLFVFFAMTINIGLVVHDKINLQNSVDLAAYYAATKQAEILNLMAHINYKMKQNWKLLSYRVRAIGDSGRSVHPFQNKGEGKVYDDKSNEFPSICTTHKFWDYVHPDVKTTLTGNLCSNLNTTLPELPTLTNIANFGFIGKLNEMALDLSKKAREQSIAQCELVGSANWLTGYKWIEQFHNYSIEQSKKFEELYEKLKNGEDLDGNKIEDGVSNTLMGNLTRSNLAALKEGPFFVNPLKDSKSMFNQINLVPIILYADSVYRPGGGCTIFPKVITHYGSGDKAKTLPTYKKYGNVDDSILEKTFTLGYEKNPWHVVYAKVNAISTPRKVFAPLGKPVALTAESYAKPFGGSIGPWMYSTWHRGSDKSDVSFDKALDKLLPPAATDIGTNQISHERLVPNYSLYPGDGEGLNSKENLLAFLVDKNEQGVRLRYERKNYIRSDLAPIGVSELSAMAPNVFDATYYSIEPDEIENYQSVMSLEKPDAYVSIKTSINDYKPNAPWALQDWSHLLSSWNPTMVSGGNQNAAGEMFAYCKSEGKIPGGCSVGGRVGYSAKLISRKYLERDLPLGGEGIRGKIKNLIQR